MRNVLIVEDQVDLARLIQLNLHDLDCTVHHASDGTEGLRQAEAQRFDLVILDLMLPGMDGIEICRRIRQQSEYTPIMMLTSRSSELDRVLGLEVGADDYITKPFSLREFLARVKALFRRVDALDQRVEVQRVLSAGGLRVDVEKRLVEVDDRRVDLTAREFDLLSHFMRHPGRVYTRAQLLDSIWGYGHEGYEHTVNSHINRLRGKIERNAARPEYILTVWGVGYKFSDVLGH